MHLPWKHVATKTAFFPNGLEFASLLNIENFGGAQAVFHSQSCGCGSNSAPSNHLSKPCVGKECTFLCFLWKLYFTRDILQKERLP